MLLSTMMIVVMLLKLHHPLLYVLLHLISLLLSCKFSFVTVHCFQESKDPTYSKMWDVMWREKAEVMMTSNQKGVDKVRQKFFNCAMKNSPMKCLKQVLSDAGGYAYFMESTSIEYQVERNCKLQQIGGLLDTKSYGIALPQGIPVELKNPPF